MPQLLALLFLLALVVGVYVIYHRKQREHFEDALEITCLLCESSDAEVLSTHGEDRYRCRSCGYHTDLATRSDTARFVETCRDIKRAVEHLQEAQSLLVSQFSKGLVPLARGLQALESFRRDDARFVIHRGAELVLESEN